MKQKRNVPLITLISFLVPVFLFAGQQEEIAANGFVKKIDGYFRAASQTSDGGYLSVSSSNKVFTVTKLSLSGKMLWDRSFDMTPSVWTEHDIWHEIRAITEVRDGYILVGHLWDFSDALQYYRVPLLIKLDPKGSIVWSKISL